MSEIVCLLWVAAWLRWRMDLGRHYRRERGISAPPLPRAEKGRK